jgi:hypothetical protein
MNPVRNVETQLTRMTQNCMYRRVRKDLLKPEDGFVMSVGSTLNPHFLSVPAYFTTVNLTNFPV